MYKILRIQLMLYLFFCTFIQNTTAHAQSYIRYVNQSDYQVMAVDSDSIHTFISAPVDFTAIEDLPSFINIVGELTQVLEDPAKELIEVWVCGSASPDGLWQNNISLSQARTESAVRYLTEVAGIPVEKIRAENLYEDWDLLYELVESSDMESREEVLQIISTKKWGERKTALQELEDGQVWELLSDDFFPRLRGIRFAAFCSDISDTPDPEDVASHETPIKDTVYVSDIVYIRDTVYIKETEDDAGHEYGKTRVKRYYDAPWMMGVKTNLLSDAMAIPSLGLEIQMSDRLSLDLQAFMGNHNLFVPEDEHTNIYGFSPELRWWFSEEIMREGFFLGLHGRCAWYTLQWRDGLLYQNGPANIWEGRYLNAGDLTPTWSVGLTCGYSLGLGKHDLWGLEFLLGAGYANCRQNLAEYNYETWEFKEHRHDHYFGLTRASINLTYRFSLRPVKKTN